MKLTWNFYSGLVAPILTLTAILILVIFSNNQQTFSLYYFPFVLLGLIMISVLSFWSLYLLYIRKEISKRFIIKLGRGIIKLGKLCFIALILISLFKLISNFVSFQIFNYKTDKIYWIISIWTLIELIHHYFYKLMYDKKKSLFEIVDDEKNRGLTSPIGGAIGIAIKKLER